MEKWREVVLNAGQLRKAQGQADEHFSLAELQGS